MSQIELESLMEQTLPPAKQMLKDDGLVVPYGAVILDYGEVMAVGVEIDEPNMKAKQVVDILNDNLIDMAHGGECRATAMYYAVRVPLPGTDEIVDAVAVSLCHAAGDALVVFHPFHRIGNAVNFGSTFAYNDQNRIFRRLH